MKLELERWEGTIPPLPYGKQGFPQGNSHPHPQGPTDLKSAVSVSLEK